MSEDDSGPSNLIAFPGNAADAPGEDVAAHPRDRDLIRRLEAIATTIGVPVATFLGAARERASEDGAAAPSQTAELLQLFGRISDHRTRDQYLALLRMLAAGEPEAGSTR